jgi:hypothetical protein
MAGVAAGLSAPQNNVRQEQELKKNPGALRSERSAPGVGHQMSCTALVGIDNRPSLGIQK